MFKEGLALKMGIQQLPVKTTNSSATVRLKTDLYIILYKYGMQKMLNGNSSYRKILIKEMEIFCEFVEGHRNNIFRYNDFWQSNLILQALFV